MKKLFLYSLAYTCLYTIIINSSETSQPLMHESVMADSMMKIKSHNTCISMHIDKDGIKTINFFKVLKNKNHDKEIIVKTIIKYPNGQRQVINHI